MNVYSGNVIGIERDRNYLGRLIAEIDTKPDSMFFFVKKLRIAIGDRVELWREENSIGYAKIIINK